MLRVKNRSDRPMWRQELWYFFLLTKHNARVIFACAMNERTSNLCRVNVFIYFVFTFSEKSQVHWPICCAFLHKIVFQNSLSFDSNNVFDNQSLIFYQQLCAVVSQQCSYVIEYFHSVKCLRCGLDDAGSIS